MDILVTRKHPSPTQRLLINLLECVIIRLALIRARWLDRPTHLLGLRRAMAREVALG